MIERISRVEAPAQASAFSSVTALSGGISSQLSHEHCNGLVFSLAEKLAATAQPVFLPAFAASDEEYHSLTKLSGYAALQRLWNSLDLAVIELMPPETGGAGYAGRLLGYPFTGDGVFSREASNCVRASVQQLRSAKNVLMVFNSQVEPDVLRSALKTGIATHIILTERLADGLL